MSHIFFFITVSIIVFSVIPLVILLSSVQYLHGVKPLVKRMSLFLVIFVAEAISNMILFYNEEVVDINITKLFYRFGWYYLYALVLLICPLSSRQVKYLKISLLNCRADYLCMAAFSYATHFSLYF